MHRATRRQLVGLALLGAVAAGAALVATPAGLVDALDGLAAHPLRFALALAAVYLVRPFLLWPATAVAVVVGYLYGPVVGVPVGLAGVVLSACPPFLLARRASGAGLFGDLGSYGARLTEAVGESRGILAARLLPLPGDAVSYAAGLSGASTAGFLGATVLGELPWTVLAVFAGASMRTLSVSGLSVDPAVVVGLAGLAVLVLAGPVYDHYTA
jgi:uncharacterized membrane protein YdjX (TVP38/TMEM64 family)